jgi:hypothetical protein
MHTFQCDILFYMKLSLGFKGLIVELMKYPNCLYLKHFFKMAAELRNTSKRMLMIVIIIWLRQ